MELQYQLKAGSYYLPVYCRLSADLQVNDISLFGAHWHHVRLPEQAGMHVTNQGMSCSMLAVGVTTARCRLDDEM